MELENDLIEFVAEVNKFYKDHKYTIVPKDLEFKHYRVDVRVISGVGISCNLRNKHDAKYICSFEIMINSTGNGYSLCFRMKDYSVLWDTDNFMYCSGLRDINNTPVFEGFKSKNMQICNDLYTDTLFQYRTIEDKADNILLLLNELRLIVSTKKYSTLYLVHTRG